MKKTHSQFVQELESISPSIEVIGVYDGGARPIACKCKSCGHTWSPIASNLISGHGCPACAAKKRAAKRRKTLDEVIEEIGVALPDVKVIGPYVGASEKIAVKCERCGYEWSAVPTSLKRGHGCPRCSKSGTSFAEQFIYLAIMQKCECEVVSRNRTAIGKELDIFIPEKSFAVEIGSWHWHEKNFERDIEKRALCEKRGIRLITIYDNCPLENMPRETDWYIYPHDLAQQDGHRDLIQLTQRLLNELDLPAECDWNVIESSAREQSKMMTAVEYQARLALVNPNIVYVGGYSSIMNKVTVSCGVCGHKWSAQAMSLLVGHGCPYCSGHRIILGKNDLASQCPEIASEWNYSKNRGLCPSEVHVSSSRKAWWICPRGHEYQSLISNRTKNSAGCPYCSGNKVLPGYNDLLTTNPELEDEWDNTGNKVQITSVSAGSNRAVWWICPEGHRYKARIADRAKRNIGCPYCAGNRVLTGYNDLATINPSLAAEWDTEKNEPLKPTEIKAGSGKKVWWRCEHGHSWAATVYSRHKGASCPFCSNKQVLVGFNDLATRYPEIAAEWDYDRNGELRPESVVFGSSRKIWWRCPSCDTEWQAKICNRTKSGAKCPVCRRAAGA